MELMATCLDKLTKRLQEPVPERILGKVAVAVSICCPLSTNGYYDTVVVFAYFAVEMLQCERCSSRCLLAHFMVVVITFTF